jgi:hypothetical protein
VNPAQSGWPRPAALIMSVLVGVVAGAAGWHVAGQLSAGDRGVAAHPPAVIGDDLRFGTLEDFQSVTVMVNLFNLSNRAVAVVDIDVPGWLPGDKPRLAADPLPARQWTSVQIDLVADCSESSQRDSTIDIVTEGGHRFQTQVRDELRWRHMAACPDSDLTGGFSGLDVGTIQATRDGRALRVDIEVLNSDRPATITGLRVDGGAEARPITVAGAFPATLDANESTTVSTEWTIDCELITWLRGLYVEIEYEQGSSSAGLFLELPTDVLTEVARFTVHACD